MNNDENQTDAIRNEIDNIDSEILKLFEKRLDISRQHSLISGSLREREMITRLTEHQDDVLATYSKILFGTISDLTDSHIKRQSHESSTVAADIKKALEETPQLFPKSAVIACQGIEGANSLTACEKLFQRPSVMYFSTFAGVFSAVEKGLCKYGILPIENSLHGSVTSVYDLMKQYDFYIVGSIKVKINNTLLAKKGVDLKNIKTVYSHEQALGQCSEFIKSQNIEIIPCENTAIAAKLVSESDRNDIAAISSEGCAELYDLQILRENINNNENNYTKFICISRSLEIYPGARRISLMMTLPHKPGSLYRLMARFAALGINITKLESRPMPDRDFEFMFYFDLDISVYDESLFDMFTQLENSGGKFVFLGCYAEL